MKVVEFPRPVLARPGRPSAAQHLRQLSWV